MTGDTKEIDSDLIRNDPNDNRNASKAGRKECKIGQVACIRISIAASLSSSPTLPYSPDPFVSSGTIAIPIKTQSDMRDN